MTRIPLHLLFGAAVLSGCMADNRGLEVRLDVSALTVPAANPGQPMLDHQGFADLSEYPLFIVARVEADELPGPVVATWPQTIPERTPDQVTLELEVSPGPARRLSVDLVLADREDLPPAVFVAPAPGEAPASVDVAAGRVTEARVELHELPTETLRATWSPASEVLSIAWVDERTGALLPPVAANAEAVETELAIGRTYWPRVAFGDGSVLDLDSQRALLEASGTTVLLELDR